MKGDRIPYGSTLPSTWNAVPLKHLATLTNGYVFNSSERSETGTPIIRIENLNGGPHFNYSNLPLAGKYQVTHGDLLFSWSGNPGTSFGPYLWTRHGKHFLNQHIFKVGVFGCEPRWLYWALKAATHWIERELTSGMIGMVHVTKEDLSGVPIPVPSVAEQRRIADFLDIETSRIDRLTELREQQLRLWAERARAFVSHLVVTSAGARTRTVDWLGSIPEEWSTPSIGRISRFFMGTTFPHEYQGKKSGDFPFIKVSDFQKADIIGRIQGAGNWISAATARELGARIVPPGSILYARVGAALLLNRRRITTQPSVIDDNVRAIYFNHGDPRFWAGILSLLDMGQLVNPGPVPSISESQVSPIRVPNPDTPTQQKIADQLETSLDQWQKARILVERQLKLLDERRQALITAAVTGHFDMSTASGRNVAEGVAV